MTVHAAYADIVRDPAFLEECDFDTNWGTPYYTYTPRDTKMPFPDIDRNFWEGEVPVFEF